MSDRFSIIGFTEAELGFVSAILLFAALSARPHPGVQRGSKLLPPTRAVSLKDFEMLQNQCKQLARENSNLRSRMDRRSHLRSRQKPSCVELKVEKSFIADLQVFATNSFQVNGQLYNLDELLKKLGPEMGKAKEKDCVQSVRASPNSRVSSNDYVRAVNSLQRYFYVDSRPSDY